MNNITFRNCEYNDVEFIVKLKELGLKWYMEKIYGWDYEIQINKTKKELDKHINDMRIIQIDNTDIGITTFYEENNEFVIGLTLIHPDFRNKGIATQIINSYIKIAQEQKKNINIKTYKYNPAQNLYKRLGFIEDNIDETHIYLKIKNN